MTDFIDAVWAHEGFGRGGGRGHESLARDEARKEMNNPYSGIRRLIDADSTRLAEQIQALVGDMSHRIKAASADGPAGPGGNLAASGYLWYWVNPDTLFRWKPFTWTAGGL